MLNRGWTRELESFEFSVYLSNGPYLPMFMQTLQYSAHSQDTHIVGCTTKQKGLSSDMFASRSSVVYQGTGAPRQLTE